MNKKVSLLIVSIILTIVVFSISTYMQKKLVNYVPTMKCMVIERDIEAFENITEEDIKYVDMPISIVSTVKVAQAFSEIEKLYLKDKIYEGQILLIDQFDTKENLMVYKADVGKEKIAIKIKGAENGAAYTIRENSLVNVYATIRSEYANQLLENLPKDFIGIEEDGYCLIKILDAVKILGTFDSNGETIQSGFEKVIDTILVGVTPEEAKQINILREIATFNITEITKESLNVEVDNTEHVSGDIVIED